MTRPLQEDLDLVLSLLPKVKEIALKYYHMQDLQVERKPEAGNSPVTMADKEIDYFLQEYLLKETPEYGWLSEEIEDDLSRLSKKRVWVVDPIDGTKQFIAKKPEFAASIALTENGEPVLGVVYNPMTDDVFTSVKGEGVCLNGSQVPRLNATPAIKDSICLTSKSETRKGLWAGYENELIQKPVGSIAYKLALLCMGKADLMVTQLPKSEWDMAAGHLMCEEMGLRVTDWNGQKITYNNEDTRIDRGIVARPEVYDEVFALFHDD